MKGGRAIISLRHADGNGISPWHGISSRNSRIFSKNMSERSPVPTSRRSQTHPANYERKVAATWNQRTFTEFDRLSFYFSSSRPTPRSVFSYVISKFRPTFPLRSSLPIFSLEEYSAIRSWFWKQSVRGSHEIFLSYLHRKGCKLNLELVNSGVISEIKFNLSIINASLQIET